MAHCTHVIPCPAMTLEHPENAKKRIALTFDDGPSQSGSSDEILALLDKYGVKATFFVVGSMIEANPDQVQREHDAGHLIENHSVTHPEFSGLSEDQMIEEIDQVSQQIEDLGIPRPDYFRPPYGDQDGDTLSTILEERGLIAVLWTIDSRDWEISDPDVVHDNVMSDLRDAWDRDELTNIILFHDIQAHTPAVIDRLIPDLLAEDCEFVQIDAIA
jgi:peptidoglycan/xylan/chitin deacetylase (PgdA/CDA1 family)